LSIGAVHLIVTLFPFTTDVVGATGALGLEAARIEITDE